jgi:hypothetical protein
MNRIAYAVAVSDVRERWRSGWLEATVYDSVVERECLAGMLGRLIWGTDTSAFNREIGRLGEEPDGTVILDVPCGGGLRSVACGQGSACATWLAISRR